MTQEVARALCEAGYMPLAEYVRLCRKNKWIAAFGAQGILVITYTPAAANTNFLAVF